MVWTQVGNEPLDNHKSIALERTGADLGQHAKVSLLCWGIGGAPKSPGLAPAQWISWGMSLVRDLEGMLPRALPPFLGEKQHL